ncbi:MAG: hypothetical protein ACREV6_19510 [Clostridium sp.]|uniref:hypothetical protein n=1 Tax=Clostridium sp. TaxID=1506 RepID=UPI003D6CD1D4
MREDMIYKCLDCGNEVLVKRADKTKDGQSCSKCKGHVVPHRCADDTKHSKNVGSLTIGVELKGYDKTKQQLRNLEATLDRILEKQEKIIPISIKPPLGLTPNDIWQLQRLQDIKQAMGRYVSVDKEIPKEWVDEYLYLKATLK